MSELISRKEALIALANGGGVIYINTYYKDKPLNLWGDAKECNIEQFLSGDWIFRLKPRTITLNGIEIPAPFEPKEGEDCRCYYINTALKHGFDWYHSTHHESNRVAWRTESDIKQVVEALRELFK